MTNSTTTKLDIDYISIWRGDSDGMWEVQDPPGSGNWKPHSRYSFSTYADNDGNVTSVQLIDLGDAYGPPATEAEMQSLEAQMETIKTIKWVVKNDGR